MNRPQTYRESSCCVGWMGGTLGSDDSLFSHKTLLERIEVINRMGQMWAKFDEKPCLNEGQPQLKLRLDWRSCVGIVSCPFWELKTGWCIRASKTKGPHKTFVKLLMFVANRAMARHPLLLSWASTNITKVKGFQWKPLSPYICG